MPTRILIAESEAFSPIALDMLRRTGQVTAGDMDRETLKKHLAAADVLWIRLRHQVDRDLLDAAPDLKMVVSPTTGLNHIDTAELERRGIHLVSLRGEVEFLRNVRATAEHTVGLMLALQRHTVEASSHVRAGGWTRDWFRGAELYEKTVGIVGYGRLGRLVARYLLAFDCRVLAADPHVDAAYVEPGVTLTTLPNLLKSSGIVSLHVDLNERTQGFFGKAQFDLMKPGAGFVNTARGELVDESALIAALESGRLSGAALDVLTGESARGMAHHPLVQYARKHKNVIVTPHIGGCTLESMRKTEEFLARRMAEAFSRIAESSLAVTA